MRVYITGIAGFLGGHLAEALLARGHEVRGCDNLIGGDIDNVPSGATFFEHDCLDIEAMRRTLAGCDVVYHCAATAYEGLSVFSPHLITQNVFGASVSTFSAAIDQGARRIIFCSSMARYGVGAPPFSEAHPAAPVDPYGVAKVAAEMALESLCRLHEVEHVVAVPHNIYGPRQRFDDPYRNVASIMANRMLQGMPPIIYGDGEQRRCFSYIDDALSCLVRMLDDPGVVGETINIGPDEEFITIRQLAALLAEITGCRAAPIHHPGRPGEVRLAYCDSGKARRLLGYASQVPLREGLVALVEHVRDRGPRPFRYDLPIEIDAPQVPDTWRHRLI